MTANYFKKLGGKRPKKDPTLLKIDQFLVEKHNKKLPYVQKPAHKPSSFGSPCFRNIYYNYFRVERDEPIDARGGKIFDLGNMYEDVIISWLKGVGEHIPYRNKGDGQIPKNKDGSGKPNPQFPIAVPEWRIARGFIDNIGVCEGKLWIYEIKSKASYLYSKMEGPDQDHVTQVTPYFKAFNEALLSGEYAHIPELEGFDVAVGVKILYVNKDSGEVKIFKLLEDELFEQMETFEQKVNDSNVFIDSKSLPPKNESKCNYCPFKEKCKVEWNEV